MEAGYPNRMELSRPESTRIDTSPPDPIHLEEPTLPKPNPPYSIPLASNPSHAEPIHSENHGELRHRESDITRNKHHAEPVNVALDIADPVVTVTVSEPVRISTVRPVAREEPSPIHLAPKPVSRSNSNESQPTRIMSGFSLSSDNLVCQRKGCGNLYSFFYAARETRITSTQIGT